MEALIDQFTTVGELEQRLTEVKERVAEIDSQFGVKQLDEAAKTEWNELNAENDVIEERLAEIAKRKERLAQIAGTEERTVSGADIRKPINVGKADWTWDVDSIEMGARTQDQRWQSLRDNALHFVEKERFPAAEERGVSRENAQEHIAKLLDTIDYADPGRGKMPSETAKRILLTGNPTYRAAFHKYLVGAAMTTDETNQLAMVQRALTGAPGSSGGFALVYQLDPTVVPTSNFSVNPFRALGRVETISGTNEYKFVTSGAITAAYGAEAAETTDNAPSLAQPDIIVEKAQAWVPFSVEIGQDWGALDQEMANLLQDAKDDLEATKFAVGAGHGSTEPKGVITGATNTVGTTTTQTFVIADVYKLFEALAPRFRPRAKFAANLFIIDKIRQFDTSGGSGVWAGPMSFGLQAQSDAEGAGSIDSSVRLPLLGRPVYEATAMGSALTTTTKILIVGDFRYFVIVDRVGLNIEVVPTVFGTAHRPTGQRGLYAYWRNSSDVLSAAAFQVLVT